MLDLDKARDERREARYADAAEREGRGETLPIVFGGEEIATLQSELPLDVLSPLKVVSEDIALLLRWGLNIANQGGQVDPREGISLFVDLLAGNENLPADLVDVVTRIAQKLLGEAGFERFMAQRPSREDVVALARGVIDWYGVSLGESQRSTDSSPSDGPPSKETSPSTSEDGTPTPETSTPLPALNGS